MARDARDTRGPWNQTRWRPKYHLRQELHDDESRTFHLAATGVGRSRLCGDGPAEPCADVEDASALRLILGHDEGDVTWCPECLRALVADFTEPYLELTPNISPPQAHFAWYQRRAETRGRDPIADGYRAQRRRAELIDGREQDGPQPELGGRVRVGPELEAEGAANHPELPQLSELEAIDPDPNGGKE